MLIPLVAIIGGYIIDYQKNKLKWQNQTDSNQAELEDLRVLAGQLKTRIENLEAIAAEDPDSFSSRSGSVDPLNDIEIDDRQTQKEKNRSKVEKISNKQR